VSLSVFGKSNRDAEVKDFLLLQPIKQLVV